MYENFSFHLVSIGRSKGANRPKVLNLSVKSDEAFCLAPNLTCKQLENQKRFDEINCEYPSASTIPAPPGAAAHSKGMARRVLPCHI